MTLPEMLRMEMHRRESIRDAILAGFEFTDSNQDRVRRDDVLGFVLGALRVSKSPAAKSNWWFSEVQREALKLGAQLIKPQNKSMFRRMRRRAP